MLKGWNRWLDTGLLVGVIGMTVYPLAVSSWQASIPSVPVYKIQTMPPLVQLVERVGKRELSAGAVSADQEPEEKQHRTAKKRKKKSPKAKKPKKVKPPKPVLTGPLDLNKATAVQLELLPGVGPVMAQRIIHYRQEHGGFRAVEELDAVSGIGPKTFAKLKPWIRVTP